MSATLNYELFANYFATDRDTNKFFIPEVKKKKEENYQRENYSRFNQIRAEKTITSFYQELEATNMPSFFEPAVHFPIEEYKKFKVTQTYF